MKILLVVFREKISFGQLIFLGHLLLFDWQLSQATVTIGSLTSQSMVSQVNNYVMDII